MISKLYTTAADSGGKLFSVTDLYGPQRSVAETLGAGGQVAADALASGTPIGAIINSVLTFIGSLGGLVRGATGHASYAVVAPLAAQFAAKVSAQIKSSFGADILTRNKSLLPILQQRFLALMSQWWGLGPALNQSIQTDLQKIGTFRDPLYEILWRFYLWVGTNVDQDSGPDEKAKIFEALYTGIFIDGFTEAGLSITKLAEDTAGFATGKPVTPPPPIGQVKLAGFSGTLAVLAIAGALIYAVARTRAAA